MALAHCILGKFLEVVCHCFPPPLDVPTFTARCLYVRNYARDPSSKRWNCGRETVWQFCLNSDFHVNLGIFYMPQIYDVGPTAILPLRRKARWGFFRPKNPTASARLFCGYRVLKCAVESCPILGLVLLVSCLHSLLPNSKSDSAAEVTMSYSANYILPPSSCTQQFSSNNKTHKLTSNFLPLPMHCL